MNNRWLAFLASLFLLLTNLPAAFAELVTIDFQATVDWVDDSGNALNGTIVPGQTLTGSYTFDTNLTDSNPDPGFADFRYPAPIPAGIGINAQIGDVSFTPNTNTDFNLHIYNGTSSDAFHAVLCCGGPAGTLSNGATVNDVFIDLYSSTSSVINTDTLNDAVANLASFSDKKFEIMGTGATGSWYNVKANITSIQKSTGRCDAPTTNDGSLGFKARVTNVYQSSAAYDSSFKVGDIISGSYRFDPATPDMETTLEYARYEHSPGNPLAGVSIDIAGTTLSSDPNTTWLNIMIDNFPAGSGYDHYHIMSMNSGIVMPDGSTLHDIGMDLHDPSGAVLIANTLADGTPTSVNDWLYRDLFIYGTNPDGSYFHVDAVVEEIGNITPSAPTPSVQISPASGPVVFDQRFDAGVVIDAGYPPIQFVEATLSNRYGLRGVNCYMGPVTPDGRQTRICRNVGYMLTEGANTLTVNITFVDGQMLNSTVSWEVLY